MGVYDLQKKSISVETPLSDEIKAINQANESIAKYGTVSHEDIDWE